MNRAELFDLWAPSDSVWSRWAKPVLFAEPPPFPAPAAGQGVPAVPPAPAEEAAPPAELPVRQLSGRGRGSARCPRRSRPASPWPGKDIGPSLCSTAAITLRRW